MSINLSDLTSPNNQDVLAEITSAADFLDPIGKLENLSRSPNKGGPALQTVALNQPRALPLIKNPAGKLGGYLYIPDVSGNYATGPSVTIGSNETWEGELDMVVTQWGNWVLPMGGGFWSSGFGLFFENTSGGVLVLSKSGPGLGPQPSGVTLGTPFNVKYGYDGTDVYVDIDGVRKFSNTAPSQSASITHPLQLNQQTLTPLGNYAIQKAKLTVNNAVVFDCDFNGSTSIRHGDTKFQAAVGGPVSLIKAGNDPVTVVKKSVLRFDGANSSLQGLFNQTIDSGYMFAAFSVLGGGGEAYARIFSVNSTGAQDNNSSGGIFSLRNAGSSTLDTYYQGNYRLPHVGLLDDENGDILHEAKIINGNQSSLVNDANLRTATLTTSISSEEFNICVGTSASLNNPAIDLEFLALFSADSVPDEATASKIRNYVNSRNQIYLRHQTDGFYFFDPQKADFTGNFTGANTLDGYITGSDNGDTDVRSNLTLVQATLNDQPSTDGYTITFNDTAEHLEFENSASQNLSGWQVVGTSLGTFAYRVNNTAVTELNLLGNLGSASYRKAGQSYGMILLPESATGADIEAARSLLIDRGAADGATGSFFAAWFTRSDIVDFKHLNTTGVTNAESAWSFNSFLSFPALDLSNCTTFANAWKNCSNLTSFPAGAKLGTEANNVNFSSAWQSSGLTSFPALDLSNGNIFANAFKLSQLTSFPEDILLGTNSTAVRFDACWMNCGGLTSFPNIDLSEGRTFNGAWWYNTSLEHFPALFTNWNPSTVTSSVFHAAWTGCSSLSSTSVENILTSIDSSGVFGTYTGLVTGTALPDAGIDIDYNVATGSLSAATNAAIDSLSGKGWEVFINGVLVIPNILDLQPAAAYSLRSFDASADPNVVNVRRSSDSALRDFKASEVSDGTLTSWVNTEYQTVTNGEFTTDSGWSKGTGWSIANGKATSDGTQTGNSYLYQLSNMGASQSQRVTLVVSGYVAGTVKVRLGDSAPASSVTPDLSSNGTYVFTLPSHSAEPYLFLQASSDFQGSIESISVVQLTADGHVTTWYDQGGTNHATQTVASSQPKIVDAGTLVTGGIDFGAQSDALFLQKDPFTSLSYDSLSSFVVASFNGNSGVGSSALGLNTSPRYYVPLTRPDGIYLSYSSLETLKLSDNTTEPTSLFSAVSGASNTSAYFNGVSAGSVSSVSGNSSKIAIGYNTATAYHNGTIQEIIIYNTDQSANRTGIENNINDTYTIY